MKTYKFLMIMLFAITLSACSTDDLDPNIAVSTTTDQEVDDATEETSEEPTSQSETEQDSTLAQSTTTAKHFYELTFSGGPMNGMTLSDSVAIEKGYTVYSDADGPEVLVVVIKKDNVFLNALLTRFDEADSFPVVDDNQIQDQTAAHLFFSFVPPGPSATAYGSDSGLMELSDFEIYSLQGLDLASLKIEFEGSFAYIDPPNEEIMVQISGSIVIEQLQFNLPEIALPN